jgi:hypothetical protein
MAQTRVAGGPGASVRPGRSLSLSQRYWDLEWSRILPWTIDDVTVEAVSFEDALPFIQANYPAIFRTEPGQSRFLADQLTEAKRRFCSEMDVFLYTKKDDATGQRITIGLMAGHPSDWSTYYLRSAAFLPEYRDRKVGSRGLEGILRVLAEAGVERCEADCSPANTPMMRAMVSHGFLLTSTSNSERWGHLVRFTKFFREEAADIYLQQYCGSQFANSPLVKGSLGRMK